jgi:hypothetical protein
VSNLSFSRGANHNIEPRRPHIEQSQVSAESTSPSTSKAILPQ